MEARRCRYDPCGERPGLLRRRADGFLLDGEWYCGERCLLAQAALNLERFTRAPATVDGFIARPKMTLFLLDAGAVTRAQIDYAARAMEHAGHGTLAGWLIQLGFTSEREVTRALCRQYGMPHVDLSHGQVQRAVLDMVPAAFAAAGRVFPLDYNGEKRDLTVAFGGHIEWAVTRVLAKMLECSVTSMIGDESGVVEAIAGHYSVPIGAYETPTAKPLVQGFQTAALAELVLEGARRFATHRLRFESYNQFLWIRYLLPDRGENFVIDLAQGPGVEYKMG